MRAPFSATERFISSTTGTSASDLGQREVGLALVDRGNPRAQ